MMFSHSRALASILLVSGVLAPVHAKITVKEVTGDVELLSAGDPSNVSTLVGGESISPLDQIVTGMESGAVLSFADDSVVVVHELTDMKVGEFLEGEDSSRTRLWLKAGEVTAEVNPREAGRSDFAIQTPTATCSVRGTGLRVGYSMGRTSQLTLHGSVLFRAYSGQSTVNTANQESQVQDRQGSVQTNQDILTKSTQVDSLPSGTTKTEQDSTNQPGSTLTNTGAATGGDTASTGGGNTVIASTNNEATNPPTTQPPPQPPASDGEGIVLVAQRGDSVVDRDGNAVPGFFFEFFGVPAFDGDGDTGQSNTAFFARGGADQAVEATRTEEGRDGIHENEPGFIEGIFYEFGGPQGGPLKAAALSGDTADLGGVQYGAAGDPDVRFIFFSEDVQVDGDRIAFNGGVDFDPDGESPSGGSGIFIASANGTLMSVADQHPSGDRGDEFGNPFRTLFGSSSGSGSGSGSSPDERTFSMDGSQVAFVGESSPEGQEGSGVDTIYIGDGTSRAVPAGVFEGGQVPASTGGMFTFLRPGPSTFRDLSFDNQGTTSQFIAFVGHHAPEPGAGEGVYVKQVGGGITAIADTASMIPGGGQTFTNFRSVSLDGGMVAFIGEMFGSFEIGMPEGISGDRPERTHEFLPDYAGVFRAPTGGNFPDLGQALIVDTNSTFSAGHPLAGRKFIDFESVSLEGTSVTINGTHIDPNAPNPIETALNGVYDGQNLQDLETIVESGGTVTVPGPGGVGTISGQVEFFETGPESFSDEGGALKVEVQTTDPDPGFTELIIRGGEGITANDVTVQAP